MVCWRQFLGLAMAALLGLLALGLTAQAQQLPPRAAPVAVVESGALAPIAVAAPRVDVDAATKAYLGQLQGDARARSDAYSEGGYGLTLLNIAVVLALANFLLWTGLSAAIRDWAAEHTHSRAYQVLIYAAVIVVIVAAVTFPLALYEDYFRERSYGLSQQGFGGWLGEYGLHLALMAATALILMPLLYAIIRAARDNWWPWAAALAIVLQVAVFVIQPAWIAPLTQQTHPLPDGAVKTAVLSLARANGIDADAVLVRPALRGSEHMRADVTELFGSARIVLSEDLVKAGPDAAVAVTAHAMGHAVMDHPTRLALLMGLLTFIGFGLAHWGFHVAIGLFGGNWQVRRLEDVAGFPLLAAILASFTLLAMPATHAVWRTVERQADIFGLNAARKPDAFARAILAQASARKLEPGAWEEWFFHAMPSGKKRIEAAMRWKAEHANDADLRPPPAYQGN